MKQKIEVLIVKPDEDPKRHSISNNLKTFQEIVEGYIEIVRPFKDRSIGLVCNEEGKILNLAPNRRIRNDVIAGTFVLVGLNMTEDGEDFTSLTLNQMMQMHRLFEIYEEA